MVVMTRPRQCLLRLRLIAPVTGWGHGESQFYGPNAEVVNSTLPRGVAGEFNVNSNFTIVVGAFAAEKQ